MGATTKRMTLAEYLPWAEALQEAGGGRHELIEGVPVAMAPERNWHWLVKGRAYSALERAVAAAGLPCHVAPDGATVVIDETTAYEPDATVQCGAPVDFAALTLDAPTIVVEVTSPSSAARDGARKLRDYFRLPSLRHHMIVDAAARIVAHHGRAAADAPIVTRTLGEADRLTLDPPGLEIAVAELFAGLPSRLEPEDRGGAA